MKERNKANINYFKVFFCILFIWGVFVSFFIPTWQIPDECTHLNLIGESIGIEHLGDNWFEKCPISFNRIVRNSDEKINNDEFVESLKTYPDKIEFIEGIPRIRISIIKHLPSTFGILIGIAMKLPIPIILILGELFSLLFYICVCYWAVKIIPIKKELVFIICSMPICIQEAASISHDAVFISLGFLYIAYLLFLKFEKEKIYLRDIIKLLILLAIVAYIKIPFVFLGLLIFSLPAYKINISIRNQVISERTVNRIFAIIFIIGILLATFLICFYHGFFIVDLLRECLLNGKRIIELFYSTFITFKFFLAESFVGNLGWLDTNMPIWYIQIVWILLMFFSLYSDSELYSEEGTQKRIKINIIFFSLTTICIFYFTMISMINHTYTVMTFGYETGDICYNIKDALYTIPYIGGLQGRYFILTVLLALLLVPSIKKKNKANSKINIFILGVYLSATIIIMGYTLLNRYW